MTRYLTKSRFKLAVECPTKLFYTGKDALYRNLKQEDTFLQALADGGFQVGKMATMLYPRGIEITARSNTEAEQQTRDLLSQHDDITLFEPAIRFENLFIRIDILIKRGNHFELIEVKAKSYNSEDPQIAGVRTEILADMLPYIQDVAFQKHVLQSAYPKATVVSYLMMPNKAVRSTVDGLNQLFKVRRKERSAEVTVAPNAKSAVDQSKDLLSLVPVDAYVQIVLNQGVKVGGSDHLVPLPNLARTLSELYAKDEQAPPSLHKGCSDCEFREHPSGGKRSGFHECVGAVTGMSPAEIDQGTVLDIWHYRKKDELLAQ